MKILLTGDTKLEIRQPSGSRDFAKCYIRALQAISEQEHIEINLATGESKLKRLFLLVALSRKSTIIHCLTAGKDVFAAYALSRLWNKPLVLSVHGHVSQAKDGARFDWRQRLYYYFYDKILSQADAVTFPSPHFFDLVYQHVKCDKHKCFIVPNGVEEEYITKARTKPLGRKIGIFGRLDKFTNARTNPLGGGTDISDWQDKIMMRRVQNLLELASGYGLSVMWVGIGDFLQSLNLPLLDAMPPVPREKVFELIDECVVVAVPSLTESFSLVALQSMARGVPVLVSDKVGISFLVNSYNAGLITNFDDVKRLKEDFENLIEGYATYSNNAIRCAKENSWTNVAKKFINIYRLFGN
jgi:glycosyltransferase involved in cell wall biosynthesis